MVEERKRQFIYWTIFFARSLILRQVYLHKSSQRPKQMRIKKYYSVNKEFDCIWRKDEFG